MTLSAGRKLAKLRAMSAHEIATRLRYEMFCLLERAGPRTGRTVHGDLRARLRPEHRRRSDWAGVLDARRAPATRRFFASTHERASMRAMFAGEYRREAADTLRHAEQVLERRIEFFGRSFEFEQAIPWNADPVSGREWPRLYHRAVPIHAGHNGYGDVKDVWELNRHQFLVDLAKAWALTGETRYWDALRDLVLSWIDDNPYAVGVNWSCALEPAFRSFSWLWAYHLCADAPMSDADHLRWLASFHDHGTFLFHHLEHYQSPYNHLVGEAAALYMLGVLFPEFATAHAWRRRGRAVLEAEVGRQFHADGGSVEQSAFYHHATLSFYLLATSLGRVNGEAFAPAVDAAIERAIEFSMWLQQPDGSTPRLGGADDGKPIRMEHLPLWDFRFVQAIGAALFNRPDFKFAAGRFYEDAWWLLGDGGHRSFHDLVAVPPAQTSVALAASGHYVLRSAWRANADYACVDCGEQAAGLRTDTVPSAAHGHADCLSVIAWLDGRPVLVDAGVFTYNGERSWVEHFRRTAAHNTLRVDAQDQAEYGGRMTWSRTYRARVEQFHASAERRDVTGSHDGYRRLPDAVDHRRTVLQRDGALVLRDEIRCGATHHVELLFQFAPGSARLDGSGAVLHDHAEMVWTGTVPLTPTLAAGGASPDEGWVAESLGVRVPAPRLRCAGTVSAPGAVFLTVFTSRGVDDTMRRLSLDEDARDRRLTIYGRLNDGIHEMTAKGLDDSPLADDCPITIVRLGDSPRGGKTMNTMTPLEPSCR